MTCPERYIATALALAEPLSDLRKAARQWRGPAVRRRQALFEFLRLRSHARHATAIALRAVAEPTNQAIARAAGHLRATMGRLLETDVGSRWDPERVADQVVREFLVRDLAPAVEQLQALALVKPVHPLTLSWEERGDVEDLVLDRLAVRLVWQEAPLVVGADAWSAIMRGAIDGQLDQRSRFSRSYEKAVGAYRSVDRGLEDALPGGVRDGFDLIRREVYNRHFPSMPALVDAGRLALGPLLTIDDLPWEERSSQFLF